MPLVTTTIGAYPKPGYVPVIDWFRAAEGTGSTVPTVSYEDTLRRMGGEAEKLFARAAAEVVADQVAAGIDIPTDGEVRRENYIHYHCRHLEGIDFGRLTEKSLREGACSAFLPTITGRLRAGRPFLADDWRAPPRRPPTVPSRRPCPGR